MESRLRRFPEPPPAPSTNCSNIPSTPKTPTSVREAKLYGLRDAASPRLHPRSIPASPPSIPALPSPVFPPTRTPNSISGMPTLEEYIALQTEYLASISCSKRDKALIDIETYVHILQVLQDTTKSDAGSPQFRFWVRKTFQLQKSALGKDRQEEPFGKSSWVALHKGKRIALKEELYNIICEAHQKCGHGGRDVTIQEVRETWRFIPKDLVARFVKVCPTCVAKKLHKGTASPDKTATPQRDEGTDDGSDDDGSDVEDECGNELPAPATPRAPTGFQRASISELVEGLPPIADHITRPSFPSVPRLLISPVSEFPPRPFMYSEDATTAGGPYNIYPTSGSSTPFSALFSSKPVSSGKTTPSETELGIPLGSHTLEVLTDFKPAPISRLRRFLLLRHNPLQIGKLPSADDLRQVVDESQQSRKSIARARSLEVFGITKKYDIPLDSALALYPAPLVPTRSMSTPGPSVDPENSASKMQVITSKRPVTQRPSPINIQMANTPFSVRPRETPDHEVSPALSPWHSSHNRIFRRSRGQGISYVGTDCESTENSITPNFPRRSTSSTGTARNEVESLPPTPSSAASIWSQDSAPNSAIFWEANAQEFVDGVDSDDDGQFEIGKLLTEPSTFELLTLQDRNFEDYGDKLSDNLTQVTRPPSHSKRDGAERESQDVDGVMTRASKSHGSEDGEICEEPDLEDGEIREDP